MGSPQILNYLLFFTIFSIFKVVFAQIYVPGYNGTERDALLALKEEFNSRFLKENWTGLMCYLNNPPIWYGIECSDGRVTGISLENMALAGKIKPDALYNLTELSSLSFTNNSISGEMMDFSNNQKLKRINLSKNLFDGEISNSLTTLNLLESLQLEDNKFTGKIPGFNQPSLKEFNVSNNELSGEIPNTKVLQSFGYSSFSGNPELCGPPSSTVCNISTNDTSNPDDNPSKHNSLFGSALGPIILVVGVVGFISLLFLFMYYYKKSRRLKKEIQKRKLEEEKMEEVAVEITGRKSFAEGEGKGKLTFVDENESFGLNDLLKASAEGLGKGNFGNCYKAVLDDESAVVVKRLRDLKPLSPGEFAKQLQLISQQKHPNLLPVIAYYYSKEEKLLVYKFAANGNVFSRLHGGRNTKGRIPFRWAARLSVARGVAQAIEFLHLNPHNHHVLVPHGNLKSSNVLLDQNDTILVSDFGLSSLIALPIAAQRLVAYKSPEYLSHKRLSKKSDVWSYGCFLLELLTGRVSAHAAPKGENGVDLGSWVHRAVREEWTAEIFDVEISVQRSANHAMLRLLQIAIRCCDKSPEKRLGMTEVVREVENIKVVEDSEDDEDLSLSQSLTDDSMSAGATPLRIMNP